VQHADLSVYDNAPLPMWVGGNVYLNGARPSKFDADPVVETDFNPRLQLISKTGGVDLEFRFDVAWVDEQKRQLVTSALLGRAAIPDLPYEQPDGVPIRIDADYFGRKRNEANPTPGPFEQPGQGFLKLRVW
jgi:alpha-N-arabinofuranosidase